VQKVLVQICRCQCAVRATAQRLRLAGGYPTTLRIERLNLDRYGLLSFEYDVLATHVE
jgi:hypothetical protein